MATDDAYAAAQAAWPGIELARDEYERWVRERAGKSLEGLRTDELYLSCVCARGDSRAIAAFEARFFGGVTAAVSRFGVQLDDIKQDLRERLFVGTSQGRPKISEYKGRGGLDRWVRAVAVRVALNATRAKKNQAHVTLGDDDFLPGGDVELAHLKATYRAEFKRAFSEALAALEPELQTYLRLYYLDNLGLEAYTVTKFISQG